MDNKYCEKYSNKICKYLSEKYNINFTDYSFFIEKDFFKINNRLIIKKIEEIIYYNYYELEYNYNLKFYFDTGYLYIEIESKNDDYDYMCCGNPRGYPSYKNTINIPIIYNFELGE